MHSFQVKAIALEGMAAASTEREQGSRPAWEQAGTTAAGGALAAGPDMALDADGLWGGLPPSPGSAAERGWMDGHAAAKQGFPPTRFLDGALVGHIDAPAVAASVRVPAPDPAGFSLPQRGQPEPLQNLTELLARARATTALAAQTLQTQAAGLLAGAATGTRQNPGEELFPRFHALQQDGMLPDSDARRFDRWVSPLPSGMLPSDSVISEWAYTWPPAAPLLRGAQARLSYLKSGTGQPIGILLQPGGKSSGAVAVYLRKGGKVVISGSPTTKERLLGAISAWTLPWGTGLPPTTGLSVLPPYSPLV